MAPERPRKQRRVCMESSSTYSSDDLLQGSSKEAPKDTSSTDAKEPCKFTLEALSNFLVLQNVFRNLSNNELEICCQVNQCWKSVADLMYITFYDVRVNYTMTGTNYKHKKVVTRSSSSNVISIKKMVSTLNNNPTEIRYNNYSFPGACKFLKEASQTGKISLDLTINIRKYYADESVNDFVADIGHLVGKFSSSSTISMAKLCEYLVSFFPNLQCLDLTDACVNWVYPSFDTSLPETQLKHLRTIICTKEGRSKKNLVALLSIAPNLKEFYNFSILHLEALVITGKETGVVKSLVYPRYDYFEDDFNYDNEDETDSNDEDENGEANPYRETVQSALEKLALLEPKLAEFDFHVSDDCPAGYLCERPRQSIVKRILQSSHDSLKRISISPSVKFDFSGLSPFTALKKFEFGRGDDRYGMKLFKELNADLLPTVFPKVSVLKMPDFVTKNIQKFFPTNVFSRWGSQIEELQMQDCYDMTADVILSLSQSFPSVKNFQFMVRGISEDLKLVLGVIGEKWPAMESLTINLQQYYIKYNEETCTFDSVFTGIPDVVLEKLKDPLSRAKFTAEEIKALREKSPLLKMSGLKTIEMDFDDCSGEADQISIKHLSTITLISKEFVFDFLPALKIVLRLPLPRFPAQLQADLSSIFNFV